MASSGKELTSTTQPEWPPQRLGREQADEQEAWDTEAQEKAQLSLKDDLCQVGAETQGLLPRGSLGSDVLKRRKAKYWVPVSSVSKCIVGISQRRYHSPSLKQETCIWTEVLGSLADS